MYNYMEEKMPQYMFVAAGNHDYFCVMMLRRTSVYFDGHELMEFENTRMGRNLLVVDVRCLINRTSEKQKQIYC